jgi:hypothetical protein
VIFTFFKEGIGNILTMPLGLLGSWKWVLNLGNGVLGLVGLVGLVTLVTLVITGNIGNRVHLGLESFCIPKQNTV